MHLTFSIQAVCRVLGFRLEFQGLGLQGLGFRVLGFGVSEANVDPE